MIRCDGCGDGYVVAVVVVVDAVVNIAYYIS